MNASSAVGAKLARHEAEAPVRWGILGTGAIARKLAADLRCVPGAELAAVGSRQSESAAAFAREFGARQWFGSYAEAVECPTVDVVYVATPNSCHLPNTLLALNAGKAVLCEKPFALTAAEAAEMITLARARQLFLMEAMWTRCFPLMARLKEWVATGVLGELKLLTADFGFRADPEAKRRVFDPALGGGALLDVGVYPVALAWDLFGAPQTILSSAHLGATGVDESCAMIFRYAGGPLAQLSASVGATTTQEVVLCGTRASVHLPRPWWRPSTMVLSREGAPDERADLPFAGFGYQFEILEVMRCLRAGEVESPLMPLDETLAIMRALDTIRAQWRE